MSESRPTIRSIAVGVAVAIACSVVVTEPALAVTHPSRSLAHFADIASSILDRGFQRSPFAVLGLLAGLALPMTGVTILIARRMVRRLTREPDRPIDPDLGLGHGPLAGQAWITVAGPRRREIALAREVHRIGRDDDNDVTLTGPASGTYAIIHRTPEQEFIVIDVGGASGPGLEVNGNRCTRAALVNGDRIGFGPAHVTFHRGRISTASTV